MEGVFWPKRALVGEVLETHHRVEHSGSYMLCYPVP